MASGSFLSISDRTILVLFLIGAFFVSISGYDKTFGQSKRGVQKRKSGILIGCLLIIFGLGIFRFNQFDLVHSQLNQFADDIIGGKGVSYVLTGYITNDPSIKGNTTKFVFRAKNIILTDRRLPVDDNILVFASYSNVKFGDLLKITAPISTPKNYDDFDYQSYLKKDDIRFVINFPKEVQVLSTIHIGFWDNVKISIYKPILKIKDKFESTINYSITEPEAGFMNGILLGTTENISKNLKDQFSKTGTSHVLAISGYNITIISWAVMAGLFYFMKRKKAFWVSVFIITIFTIMTGASASVVRASIMGLVLLSANGLGRLYDPKNSIFFAGTVMLFLNPLILKLDVGFQLSFLAVLGLMYIYPILQYWTCKAPELLKIKETLLATVSAQIFVAPLLAYHFQSLSLISIVANILILPFVPAAMALGFVSGLSGMVWVPLGQLFGYFAWAVTKYQVSIVENLASFPQASISWNISLPVLVFIYSILIITLWRLNKHLSRFP